MRQTRTGAGAKVSERSEDKSVDRRQPLKRRQKFGEVAEWSNAADSKSVDRFIRSGGSNPPLSAINALWNQGFFVFRSFEQSFPYFSSTASGAPPFSCFVPANEQKSLSMNRPLFSIRNRHQSQTTVVKFQRD